MHTHVGSIVVGYDQDECGEVEDGVGDVLDQLASLADSTSDDSDDEHWYLWLEISSPETAERALSIIHEGPEGVWLVRDTVIRRHQVVTLREIEQAEIPLDAKMGYNEAEHREMLDDADLFRLAVSPDAARLEIYQSVPFGEPEWVECVAWPMHPSGHSTQCARERITRRIHGLVRDESTS